MLILIKVSVIACGYGDSVRPEAELKRSQLARRIMVPPSLLEMLGFGFFPCGWLAGAWEPPGERLELHGMDVAMPRQARRRISMNIA